ncbi:hypothetical protein DL93DRAFT_1096497 [Clavulina sp. PMI_390]|nr:hypothetical protein DL93DRAFT_1096497 [Clavulina sp. PMI_390]
MMEAISLLPSELLLLVFEQTIPTVDNSPPAVIAALTSITAVSSFWRHIAINNAPFWTDIYTKWSSSTAYVSVNPTQILASDLDRVRCFIQRSKQLPLHLHFFRSCMLWDHYLEEQRSQAEHDGLWTLMYDLLEPHMRRCQFISIHTAGISFDDSPLQFMHDSELPLLQRIRFTGVNSSVLDVHDEEKPWKIRPENAPMKNLSFSDQRRYLPRQLDLPWPCLSSLELRVNVSFWPKDCSPLCILSI